MIHDMRWTARKIARLLAIMQPLVYRERRQLEAFRCRFLESPQEDAPVGSGVDDSRWTVVEPNTYWGRWRTDFVMRGRFRVPGDWEHDASVALHLPLGQAGDFSHPEALVYIDSAPFAACDRHHQEILLSEDCRDGGVHRLALHGWTGLGAAWKEGEQHTRLLMGPCAVVQIDQPTRDFIATARVALGVASSLDDNDPAKGVLLNALDEAFKVVDTLEPFAQGFYESVPNAHAVLRQGVAKAGQPLDVDIVATGHAHIDVAWLWTLGQTRRKAGRTFHTVLRLMEQFPEYHFTQSQPQLYDFVRVDYPDLFEAIKQRVGQGHWEPIGGMWVEADCNISGPESLARQLLLGRSFFRQHFGAGAESPVLWLPDVFGYCWNLPQLMRQAGLEYFFTTKIGWNEYNRLPYDSFWWQGLDGTRVLTHFTTTPHGQGSHVVSTYNAAVTPEQALGTWRTLQQKASQRTLLMAYGYGDGGGGPTREMLENIGEMNGFPATPRVRQGSVAEFFGRLEAESGERLPVWNGELYLEYHRGTYTTQSRNKRANRRCEFLLHDAEFLATQAKLVDSGYQYPADALRKAWRLVCLNQFHDIIPGSSIGPVYEESLRQYAEVERIGANVRDTALSVIARHAGGDLLVVNPTAFTQDELAFWPERLDEGQSLRRADGTPVPVQPTGMGTWIQAGAVPPLSVTPLFTTEGKPPVCQTGLLASPRLLENECLRVELDKAGDITRIFDKVQEREVLAAGAIGNQLQAFEDRPLELGSDAWDLEIYYDDRMWSSEPATSVEVEESGPLHAVLVVKRRILHSEYVQRISLAYDSPRLDFETTIDWSERHVLLKAAFPVDVLSPVATYEIQFGNVERPTHRNTSWDWARFEVCAQKWADLSEGGYGVSLLNDCKYGHDIRDNVMRISLLRSPTSPDPEADQGEHRFAYSLLPHAGGWSEATIAAAYHLNDPLIVAASEPEGGEAGSAGSSCLTGSLVSVDSPNVVVETVKWAEDGEGIIVRLYESQRRRGRVILTACFSLAAAWRTNLLEENQEKLEIRADRVPLSIRPYEIVTIRLMPAQS